MKVLGQQNRSAYKMLEMQKTEKRGYWHQSDQDSNEGPSSSIPSLQCLLIYAICTWKSCGIYLLLLQGALRFTADSY